MLGTSTPGLNDFDPFGSAPLATPQGSPIAEALTLPHTPSNNPDTPTPPVFESESDDELRVGEIPIADAVRAPPPPRTLEEAWRHASDSQTHSTPASKNLRNPKTKSNDGRKVMESELGIFKGKKVKEVSVEWARALYDGVASAEDINRFLRDCNLYNRTRKKWVNLWKHVERANAGKDLKEESLYDDILAIITAALEYFEHKRPQQATTGTTREILDTHKSRLAHDNGKSRSLPDFAIKATGPSFQRPSDESGDDLGYTNIASVFDVKVGRKKGSANEQAKQLGVYNMQMFIQQPNRNFSRSLILTEEEVRLVHYDHSGCYVTPYFNFHDSSPTGGAHVLIRWILGLSSYREEDLGLDTSVCWTINDAGRKSSGTLTAQEYNEETQTHERVVYNIDMSEPPFVRPSLCGRGTTIWNAEHSVTGEKVMIKESWRTGTRVAESEYLKWAKECGIEGVVEMLAFQDNCAQTKWYRPEGFEALDSMFHNRVKLRIVMKKYGTSVWYFRTRLQLMRAFLAVILAHRELFKHNILHRDISMQNINLGAPGKGAQGPHGVLLDFDMAIWTDRSMEDVNKDERTGFILYQSYFATRNACPGSASVPHDYLDDLEGFFLVLAHIMLAFEAPGQWKKSLPVMGFWLQPTVVDTLATSKKSFMREPIRRHHISDWWGEACKDFLLEFRKVMGELLGLKMDVYEEESMSQEEREAAVEDLAKVVPSHVDRIKVAFETVIAELVKEGVSPEELRPYPQLSDSSAIGCTHFPLSGVLAVPPPEYCASPIPLHNFDSQGIKRGSEENEDDGTDRKRMRSYRSPLSETADFDNETTPAYDSEGEYDSGSDLDE